MARLFVGLSGYAYKEWQGEDRFYPPGLKQAQYLEYYSGRYNALEADGTWYQMPTEAGVAKWIEGTPGGFCVSPKMHRKVTHFKRLKPAGFDSLKLFMERLDPLEKAAKLGPTLIQLPPNLKRDDELLETLLRELPPRPARFAIEFRNESWHASEVETILGKYNSAWVACDTNDDNVQLRETADHIYIRLRRDEYSGKRLADWASYLKGRLAAGKNCFVFCKHKDAEAPWIWADRLLDLANGS